jgi:hypothetical protein
MLTVASYLKTVPEKNNNSGKIRVLLDFINGVKSCGDNGIVMQSNKIIESDVAVIQGFVHEDGKHAPHLTFRKTILLNQTNKNKRTVIADSNLFLYADPQNTKGYLRLSYDGIFPNSGEYCYDNPDPKRWKKIKQDLKLELKPWRSTGSHILLCLQRNGGWSMKGLTVIDFFNTVIKEIRRYSDRPILVRTHPGDKKSGLYTHLLTGKNITISNNSLLSDDLKNAWATVIYNSSPGVASAIEGIPVFVIDPEFSQYREVANLDLSQIENPVFPDRENWVHKMAQCHWNFSEISDGTCWKHMRNWAKK